MRTIIEETSKLKPDVLHSLKATAPLTLLHAMNGIVDSTLPMLNNSVLKDATSEESVTNAKGLMGLSKSDVLNIVTYVLHSLALPIDVASAETRLGYKSTDFFCTEHPEFTPQSFVNLYKPIHTHAGKWNSLKNQMISQGNKLEVYGKSFITHADFVIGQVREMKAYTKEVGEVEVLPAEDEEVKVMLTEILDDWKAETTKYKDSTTEVLNALTAYNSELSETIKPSVNVMQGLLTRLNISDEMTQLTASIKELDNEIAAKEAEYSKYVGQAFIGAAGMIAPGLGIIAWSITGGIFGSKAEEARKEKNKLKDKRNEMQANLNSLTAVSSHVMSVSNSIVDLGAAITNAIIGLTNLQAVWDLINEYIIAAKDSLMQVDGTTKLFRFENFVLTARNSWAEVPSLALGMLDIFNEAYKEADKNKK